MLLSKKLLMDKDKIDVSFYTFKGDGTVTITHSGAFDPVTR